MGLLPHEAYHREVYKILPPGFEWSPIFARPPSPWHYSNNPPTNEMDHHDLQNENFSNYVADRPIGKFCTNVTDGQP